MQLLGDMVPELPFRPVLCSPLPPRMTLPSSPYPSLPQLTPNTALPVLLPTFLGKEETSEDVGP